MRLKSELWVKAYLRRCAVNGATAVVARRGDGDAGAIFIKVMRRDGGSTLFTPAPAGRDDADFDRRWNAGLGGAVVASDAVDAHLAREIRFDADIWIVDVEDGDGRHFLGDDLVA
ncbi:MAG: DUF1491 family protein [Hyphomicrobium sp.]|nr:DUF1491 family protein [Hyphomicrobium sp.]